MMLREHRLARTAFTLFASAAIITFEGTGCGTSSNAPPTTQTTTPATQPASGATDGPIIIPASAETTAAIGVTSWGINNKVPNGSVLIAGIDDAAHVMRGLFSADLVKDGSGEASLSFTLIFPGTPVSMTVQSQGGQDVLQSNEFGKNPDASRALKLLNADLQKSVGPAAGALGATGTHPLDILLFDGGSPLVCDPATGKTCTKEMTDLANGYLNGKQATSAVWPLAGSCGPCSDPLIREAAEWCYSQSASRPGGTGVADPCLHLNCGTDDLKNSHNTDSAGWTCLYNSAGAFLGNCDMPEKMTGPPPCPPPYKPPPPSPSPPPTSNIYPMPF
jgi:hypothetical protein